MIASLWILWLLAVCCSGDVAYVAALTNTTTNAILTQPTIAPPYLGPLAQRWLDVVEGFGHELLVEYIEVAKEYLTFYKGRAAKNSATIKRLGVHADIPALVAYMWQDECNIWLGIREYLTRLEQRIYPGLFVLSRSIVHLVGVEFRNDPKVIESIRRLENVIQVAKDEYAETARDCRNRGLRALRRQMNAMLAMHQQATTNGTTGAAGQKWQRDYEVLIDRTSKPVLDAMRSYWTELRHTFVTKVAAEDHVQSLFLLTML